MAVDGKALAAVAVGSVFVWSGVKGWSVLGTMSDLLTGVKPSQTNTLPLSTPVANAAARGILEGGEYLDGSSSGIGVAPGYNSQIAQIGLQYQGHAYRFGGAPGVNAQNPWDCSSFVNYVVGVRARRPIPGYSAGRYNGTVHGPASGQWAVWPGLQKISRQEVQAGDILVWFGSPGHIGIAIDNTRMVSALNPTSRTKITTISGFSRGIVSVMGRLKQ